MNKTVSTFVAGILMIITYVPAISLWLPVETKQLKEEDVEKAHFMNAAEIED